MFVLSIRRTDLFRIVPVPTDPINDDAIACFIMRVVLRPDVARWCEENLLPYNVGYGDDGPGYMHLSTERDAVAFKLRWFG